MGVIMYLSKQCDLTIHHVTKCMSCHKKMRKMGKMGITPCKSADLSSHQKALSYKNMKKTKIKSI